MLYSTYLYSTLLGNSSKHFQFFQTLIFGPVNAHNHHNNNNKNNSNNSNNNILAGHSHRSNRADLTAGISGHRVSCRRTRVRLAVGGAPDASGAGANILRALRAPAMPRRLLISAVAVGVVSSRRRAVPRASRATARLAFVEFDADIAQLARAAAHVAIPNGDRRAHVH